MSYECECHRHITDAQLVVLLERDTAKCDRLWMRWCLVHIDEIEAEVMPWLRENSRCITIMKLQGLQPPKKVGRS